MKEKQSWTWNNVHKEVKKLESNNLHNTLGYFFLFNKVRGKKETTILTLSKGNKIQQLAPLTLS